MRRGGLWLLLGLALGGCGGPGDGAGGPTEPAAAAPEATAVGPAPASGGPGRAPLRVGWQTTWATEAQLALLLRDGPFLADQGFDATFVPFSYGAPLNEAALAGAVDVLFTADQPALVLANKAPQWGIIGRLMYNRVGVMSALDGPVATPADLRGRRLAVPFGAAAHRAAIGAARGAGVEVGPDLELVNLGIEELVGVVVAGSSGGRWGELDAVAAWDPAFAELEERKLVRTIHRENAVGLVVMDDRYEAAHPGAGARFLTALAGATQAFAADPLAAHQKLQAEGGTTSLAALQRAAAVEPNLEPAAPGDPPPVPRLTLAAPDLRRLEEAATFLHAAGIVKSPVDLARALRPTATGAAAANPAPEAGPPTEPPPADGAQPWAPEGRAP